MDMTQYRGLFLSETREHLNNMNRLVVALEESPGDRAPIDSLFREAHSIKGMAASMGFERTAELAHHLEDLLDHFRSSGQIAPSAVDRLLEGLDLLEALLDDLSAERPERRIDNFLQAHHQASAVIGEAAEDNTSPADEPSDLPILVAEDADEIEADEPTTVVHEDAHKNEEAGEGSEEAAEPEAFQVIVDLREETTAPAARCLLILRELDKAGEILSVQPDQEELQAGKHSLQVKVWLRTLLTKDQVEENLRTFSDVKRVGFVDDRRKEPREDKVSTVRIRTDLLDQFVNLTGELITHRYMLETAAGRQNWAEMAAALAQTGRLIGDLHHSVLQARLMPLDSITSRLPRMVRDLSRKTGKQVTLQVTGAEVGLDRVVLEQLSDPLVHLLRNAVDHGIAQQGGITISARREKDLVLVEVADDGVGMDPAELRQKACERGFLSESQAEQLSDRDALMLICQPGFSTMSAVTETSGRGVGMDVVKAAVENLGGSLEIQSGPDLGTRFQMRLPISIAIIKILRVLCAGKAMAIPITRILRTLDLATASIKSSGRQRVFELGEEIVPLVSLTSLLGLADPPETETTWVVLTELQGRRVGLQVDRFQGQREAFVKSLGFPLNRLLGLSGATIEGNGQVLFIIDPHSLLENHAVVIGGPSGGGANVIPSS